MTRRTLHPRAARVPATIGLVLGMGFIVVSFVSVVVGLIVISIILSNDSLTSASGSNRT